MFFVFHLNVYTRVLSILLEYIIFDKFAKYKNHLIINISLFIWIFQILPSGDPAGRNAHLHRWYWARRRALGERRHRVRPAHTVASGSAANTARPGVRHADPTDAKLRKPNGRDAEATSAPTRHNQRSKRRTGIEWRPGSFAFPSSRRQSFWNSELDNNNKHCVRCGSGMKKSNRNWALDTLGDEKQIKHGRANTNISGLWWTRASLFCLSTNYSYCHFLRSISPVLVSSLKMCRNFRVCRLE